MEKERGAKETPKTDDGHGVQENGTAHNDSGINFESESKYSKTEYEKQHFSQFTEYKSEQEQKSKLFKLNERLGTFLDGVIFSTLFSEKENLKAEVIAEKKSFDHQIDVYKRELKEKEEERMRFKGKITELEAELTTIKHQKQELEVRYSDLSKFSQDKTVIKLEYVREAEEVDGKPPGSIEGTFVEILLKLRERSIQQILLIKQKVAEEYSHEKETVSSLRVEIDNLTQKIEKMRKHREETLTLLGYGVSMEAEINAYAELLDKAEKRTRNSEQDRYRQSEERTEYQETRTTTDSNVTREIGIKGDAPSELRQRTAVDKKTSANFPVIIDYVDKNGDSIKLANNSAQLVDLSNFVLKQGAEGKAATFVFPPNTLIKPNKSIQVLSNASGKVKPNSTDTLVMEKKKSWLKAKKMKTELTDEHGKVLSEELTSEETTKLE